MQRYTTRQMTGRTGVSTSTLRYYERIGLLDTVERLANGHRRYSDADVTRVEFLKRLRATGMPIRGMLRYVTLFRAGAGTVGERCAMLTVHRAQVQAQVAEMADTIALLSSKIASYGCETDAAVQAALLHGNGHESTIHLTEETEVTI